MQFHKSLMLVYISLLIKPGVDPNLPIGDLYIISVGIDKTSAYEYDFKYCAKDAIDFNNKIRSDLKLEQEKLEHYKKTNNKTKLLEYRRNAKKIIKNVHSLILINEDATKENIKNTFLDIIKRAKPQDDFIFSYSGVSVQSIEGKTFLLPYINSNDPPLRTVIGIDDSITKGFIPLAEIAHLMEQIASENQYVISEAGYGKAFGLNLVYNLFESNPQIIEGTDRNRVIITTKGPGFEGGSCNDREIKNGRLYDFILSSPNLHLISSNFRAFELNLLNAQRYCEMDNPDYVKIYNESDYRDIFLRITQKAASRGSKAKNNNTKTETLDEGTQDVYAFVIATNEYDGMADWNNLKNPINDAKKIADILETKFNVKTKSVFNKNKTEVLKSFIEFNSKIDGNDKLIFFIAGHGYYSESFSDGYLVFKDSNDLGEDYTLDSYLSMAKINRLLDGVKAKQVFSIFDVCYGASFELNNADLVAENYSNTKFDKSIEEFIQETDENYARIVLASGKYEVPDYWNNSLDHSPFADKLITALENEDDFLSPGKIYSYVRGNATTPILKEFGRHHPRGDFLLKVLN
ncbi:caspase family protein [Winogradskyella ouciana]|uniref:Peptidase C14 caspase domain-containing protein n=1 Tax=Winogradskyella ouciana TaxID=2608631 RepID=A0A7K1GG16_9FLAO|nr:caspase family protein [Winogradskyella ouciana]MTE28250.1 hypothetical protein [Winogradskyella ouciana]